MERNENAEFVESAWDLGMIWGFSGQLKYSELFYGYYTNDTYRSMAKFSGDSDSKVMVNMNKIDKKTSRSCRMSRNLFLLIFRSKIIA